MSKKDNGARAATDGVSRRAHESVDHMARTAGKAEERIRHEAGDAKARVSDVGQKARERSDETLHSIGAFVEENPLTSLGLAFAAGTLLYGLRRRS